MGKQIDKPAGIEHPWRDQVSTGSVRYVYVAGPLTNGDSWLNVREACQVADKLMLAGFFVFIPHLSMFADMLFPKHYEKWLQQDLGWLAKCEAVVWLEGNSKGTDREKQQAWDSGKIVWPAIDVDEFIARFGTDF